MFPLLHRGLPVVAVFRFFCVITVASLLANVALTQTRENELKSKVTDIAYPPLGDQARIQGDVRLRVESGVITVFSGHPMLAETAREAVKSIGLSEDRAQIELTCHFILVDVIMTPVKRGSAFERAVFRILRLKTDKLATEFRCEERVPPVNDLRVAGAVELWIYGKARCVQTQHTTAVTD